MCTTLLRTHPPITHFPQRVVGYHRVEPKGSRFMKTVSDAGLKPSVAYHNLSPAELYEKALLYEPGTHMVSSGALATLSGAKTGRCPRDKRVVREEATEKDIWWGEGSPNFEMDERYVDSLWG